MIVDGPLGGREDLMEVLVKVLSHAGKAVHKAVSIFLGLPDEDTLARIWVAAFTDITGVSDTGIVFENMAAVHHHFKERKIGAHATKDVDVEHRLQGAKRGRLHIV